MSIAIENQNDRIWRSFGSVCCSLCRSWLLDHKTAWSARRHETWVETQHVGGHVSVKGHCCERRSYRCILCSLSQARAIHNLVLRSTRFIAIFTSHAPHTHHAKRNAARPKKQHDQQTKTPHTHHAKRNAAESRTPNETTRPTNTNAPQQARPTHNTCNIMLLMLLHAPQAPPPGPTEIHTRNQQ